MRPLGRAEAVLDVPAIGRDYFAGVLTLQAIADKYAISTKKLAQLRDRMGWAKRREIYEVDRSQIINRMFRLLERQIIKLEATMKDVTDKEVTVLGNLVRTLEKLIDIEDAQTPKVATKAHSDDMHDIRAQLEKRINDLTKG